jgi:hypothetical protein
MAKRSDRRSWVLRRLAPRLLALIAVSVFGAAPAALGAAAPRRGRPRARAQVLLGDDAVERHQGSLTAGRSEAFRFRAHASGVVTQMHLYIDAHSTARAVVVGLYRDAGDRPGSLLSTGSISSPKGGSWNTASLTPSPLVYRRLYWLTVLGVDGTLRYRDRRHGRCPSDASARARLSALPASWSAGRIHHHAHCPISAYAIAASATSLTDEAGPVDLAAPLHPVSPAAATAAIEEPPPPPPPAPTNTALPAISGTTTEGQTLKATNGTWSASPTSYAYQWQDCNALGEGCLDVSGAKSSTYTLKASDVGDTMRVVVTATNEGGSTPATSAATAAIEEAAKGSPPSPECTQQTSSVSEAASEVASAAAGSAICLTAGSYGSLDLSGGHAGNVTIESAPGSSVSLTTVHIAEGTSNVTVHNFDMKEVFLAPGVSHVTIDHNNITGGGEGVINSSVNCSSPNAPAYSGCTTTAPDTYITISANKIHGFGEGGSEDAIHLSHWEHITITANDIYNLEEHGNHTDAFQSVFGGSYMTFDHNYEHDNQSQGFFIKDGDASNVTVTDNLFLRNDNLGEGENNIQVFNTTNFTMTNNTVWDGQGDLIRSEEAAEELTATVNHNVEQIFSVLNEGGPAYKVTEDYDIFQEEPFALPGGIGPHSTVVPNPTFVNTSTDDYELKSNPNHIGVDWQPSEYVYGPTGD